LAPEKRLAVKAVAAAFDVILGFGVILFSNIALNQCDPLYWLDW